MVLAGDWGSRGRRFGVRGHGTAIVWRHTRTATGGQRIASPRFFIGISLIWPQVGSLCPSERHLVVDRRVSVSNHYLRLPSSCEKNCVGVAQQWEHVVSVRSLPHQPRLSIALQQKRPRANSDPFSFARALGGVSPAVLQGPPSCPPAARRRSSPGHAPALERDAHKKTTTPRRAAARAPELPARSRPQ